VTTAQVPDRFPGLPDEQTLAATVVALEEYGFSVEVADDLDAAPGEGRLSMPVTGPRKVTTGESPRKYSEML
jgi:hypothetical protein